MVLQMFQAVAELERIRSLSKTRDGLRSTFHTTLGITPRGKWKLIPRKSDGSCPYFPDEFHELYYLGVHPYGMLNASAHLICSQIGRCFQGPKGCGVGNKTPIPLKAPKSKLGKSDALKPNASKVNSLVEVFPTAMSSFQKLDGNLTKTKSVKAKATATEKVAIIKTKMPKAAKRYRQTFLSIQEHGWVLLPSLPKNESELQSRLHALPLELRSIIWSYAFEMSCECSLLAIVNAKKQLNVKKMSKDHPEIRAPLMLLRDAGFKQEAEKAFYSVHEVIVDAKNLKSLLETHGQFLTAIKVVVGIWDMDTRNGGKARLEAEGEQLQADLYDLMDCPLLRSVKLVLCVWSEEHYKPTTWTCDYDWSEEADACPCCNQVEYGEIRCKMEVLAEPLLELEQSGLLESVFMRIYYSKPGIYPRHFGPYAMLPRPHPCRHELYTELQCEETREPSCASKRTPPGEDVHDGGEKNFQDDKGWAPMYSYLGFQIYDWVGDAVRSYEQKMCQCRLFAKTPRTWYPEYVAFAHRVLWRSIVEVLAEEDEDAEGEKVILQCLSGFSHSAGGHAR